MVFERVRVFSKILRRRFRIHIHMELDFLSRFEDSWNHLGIAGGPVHEIVVLDGGTYQIRYLTIEELSQ